MHYFIQCPAANDFVTSMVTNLDSVPAVCEVINQYASFVISA